MKVKSTSRGTGEWEKIRGKKWKEKDKKGKGIGKRKRAGKDKR